MSSPQLKPKVFYSKIISPEKLAEIANLLNDDFHQGKIGIKINIGNKKEKNDINPEFYRPLVNYFQGTVIDSNSLYISAEKNIINKNICWAKFTKIRFIYNYFKFF